MDRKKAKLLSASSMTWRESQSSRLWPQRSSVTWMKLFKSSWALFVSPPKFVFVSYISKNQYFFYRLAHGVTCSVFASTEAQRERERERERVRKMEVDGSTRDEDMADSPTHSQQTGSHLHPSISTHTHATLFLFGC